MRASRMWLNKQQHSVKLSRRPSAARLCADKTHHGEQMAGNYGPAALSSSIHTSWLDPGVDLPLSAPGSGSRESKLPARAVALYYYVFAAFRQRCT